MFFRIFEKSLQFVPFFLALWRVLTAQDPCDDPWYACNGPEWILGGPFDDGYGYAQLFCYKILNYDPNLDGAHFYWDDAERACNLYSANLVSVHSETENIFIGRASLPYYLRQNSDHPTYKGFWLGMRRFPVNEQKEGQPYPYDAPFTQIWSDGTPVTYGLQPVNSHGYSLSPWVANQPDYGGPNSFETCVVTYMFPSYFGAPYLLTTPAFYNKWNDIGCGKSTLANGQQMVVNMAGAICKKPMGQWCQKLPGEQGGGMMGSDHDRGENWNWMGEVI